MGILVSKTCWGNKTTYFVASGWFFSFHYILYIFMCCVNCTIIQTATKEQKWHLLSDNPFHSRVYWWVWPGTGTGGLGSCGRNPWTCRKKQTRWADHSRWRSHATGASLWHKKGREAWFGWVTLLCCTLYVEPCVVMCVCNRNRRNSHFCH
jgi:hypothetical protein